MKTFSQGGQEGASPKIIYKRRKIVYNANVMKKVIEIRVETTLPDSALTACLELAGFIVDAIRPRKGIFG